MQSALVQVTVDLSLTPSERQFVLPASGTRSLLFRFGEDTFGGVLTDASNRDFQPGGNHAGASLDVWAADTSAIVVGTEFVIWYDGDIGRGVVTATATATATAAHA